MDDQTESNSSNVLKSGTFIRRTKQFMVLLRIGNVHYVADSLVYFHRPHSLVYCPWMMYALHINILFFKNFKNKCENQNNQVRERNGILCGCICAVSPEGDLLSWVNHWINMDIGFHQMIFFFINKTNNTKCIYICIFSRVNELLNITQNPPLLRVHRIHVRE